MVKLFLAYVSYVGYFTKPYRVELLEEKWIPFLKSLQVDIYVVFVLYCIKLTRTVHSQMYP